MIIHMSGCIIFVQLNNVTLSVLETNFLLSNKPAWDNELTHYTERACLEQEPPNSLTEKYYKYYKKCYKILQTTLLTPILK